MGTRYFYQQTVLYKPTKSIILSEKLKHCGVIVLYFQIEICHFLSDVTVMVTQINDNLWEMTDINLYFVVLLKDIA